MVKILTLFSKSHKDKVNYGDTNCSIYRNHSREHIQYLTESTTCITVTKPAYKCNETTFNNWCVKQHHTSKGGMKATNIFNDIWRSSCHKTPCLITAAEVCWGTGRIVRENTLREGWFDRSLQ